MINPYDYKSVIFFTGAGMSAECGVPTYRGRGGIWKEYNWEEYACQSAFEGDPEKVLKFHEIRRRSVLNCAPHLGHKIIADIEGKYRHVNVVTQNIDGMHQRAGTKNIVELHGSLWRVRCEKHGVIEDLEISYKTKKCPKCSKWLRPDITWFEDLLDELVLNKAKSLVAACDLFISIGTSGIVYPAAGFPKFASEMGARTVYVNIAPPENGFTYDDVLVGKASEVLWEMFNCYVDKSD